MPEEQQAIRLNDLITRCRGGDMAAYKSIYDQYAQAMYHTSLRIVNSSTDAEDILQESFLTAFTSLKTLKENLAFPGWLKRIVINKSLNLLKREKVNCVELALAFDQDQEDEFIDEEIYQVQLTTVWFELGQLPASQRIVISLHVFEDLGFEEIGKLLAMPSATVRSHYARGRKKIAGKIKRTHYGR